MKAPSSGTMREYEKFRVSQTRYLFNVRCWHICLRVRKKRKVQTTNYFSLVYAESSFSFSSHQPSSQHQQKFCIILDITQHMCLMWVCVWPQFEKVQSTLEFGVQERRTLAGAARKRIFSSFLSLISEVLAWNSLNFLWHDTNDKLFLLQ